MKLCIVGTGYVGLVTGACFAEMGNHVVCIDRDSEKIELLEKDIVPIYEPGLEDIVSHNHAAGRLSYSTSLEDNINDADIIFIAVGTPPGEDGSADLSHVLGVAGEIGRCLQREILVVSKSTVPVGTCEKIKLRIQEELDKRGVFFSFGIASNPEFLKEGAAVEDFMKPDRIIVGVENEDSANMLRDLYAPFNRNHERTIIMGLRDAEMTKYAANAMLATKISFMNEIAGLCDRLNVDVEKVRVGIGSDTRIGYSFIYPGAGYGGSCFPKDVKALMSMSRQNRYESVVLNAVEERNQRQKQVITSKVKSRFGSDLSGMKLAMWGLAFKPGTDDMREASSLEIIGGLVEAGAKVIAYDPVSMKVAREVMASEWIQDGAVTLVDEPYSALEGAGAMLLVTEWKQFRNPDFGKIVKLLKMPVIFDGRNQYDPEHMDELGIEYHAVGRRNTLALKNTR